MFAKNGATAIWQKKTNNRFDIAHLKKKAQIVNGQVRFYRKKPSNLFLETTETWQQKCSLLWFYSWQQELIAVTFLFEPR